MDSTVIAAIVAIVAVIIGIFLGKMIFAKNTKKELEEAEVLAKKTIEDAKTLAETLKEKKLLEAKEHFLQLKSSHDKEVSQRTQKLSEGESKLKQQQQALNDKTAAVQRQSQELEHQKENLDRQNEAFNIKKAELDRHHEEHIKRLEKVAGLSAEQAKTELMEAVKEEARTRAMSSSLPGTAKTPMDWPIISPAV